MSTAFDRDPPTRHGRAFGAARRALAEWLSHLLAVAALLSGLHAVEALAARVGLYDRLSTVFDAGDAGLIIGLLVFGVYSVLRVYNAELGAEPGDFAGSGRAGWIALHIAPALQPPASFKLRAVGERLIGQLLVYATILVVSIYLCLFALAAWRVAVVSLAVVLLAAIAGVAVFAPKGSPRAKVKWLVEIRAAVGSFVAAVILLLLIEEILRRIS